MTSLSIKIAGVDFTSQYVTGSFSLKQQLKNKGDTLDLQLVQKAGQTIPQEGQEIIVKDGSRYLFGGFVSQVTSVEQGVGQQFTMSLEATDYTYILNNKIAIRTYTNQTLHYIVNDLISTFVPGSYGVTITGVENPGPIVGSVFFNYVSIRKCFEKLASLLGYVWWVDYQRNINFSAIGATSAPEKFTDASPGNHNSMAFSIDTTQVRNSIVLKGGTTAAANNATDAYTGDGNARQWFLKNNPTATPTVTVDGVSKTVGSDPTDNDVDFDYMYNADQQYLRASAHTTTLTTSNVISIVYPYNFPILAVVEDAASIAIMKTLEGGDGRHQYAITDNTVVSKLEALQKAKNQLTLYSLPQVTGTIVTRTSLLQNGSYFSAGQAITINSPAWGISSDQVFLAQEVDITTIEDGSRIEYIYTITTVGPYGGF